MLSAAFIVGVPLFAEAFGYAGYPQAYGGAPHVFAPYTYVNNYPYGNAGTYQYPMQASSYSYTYPSYMYSGYGCYPFYVADPHQWVYDYWTGTWY